MTATVIRGDARNLPLPDSSVDLIVTSPPYFALRSYQDGGEHYSGQIGSEPTPGEFLDALIECTREMMRVLKPSGSIWVNLGDKYSTGNSGQSALAEHPAHSRGGMEPHKQRSNPVPGFRPKSLLGLPWRYALRCIDELGLILRAEVIWSKPNGLPESVTDRVRRSHEQWFHMTKQPRYYAAVDTIREPQLGDRVQVKPRPNSPGMPARGPSDSALVATAPNPLGKLPGSVWSIPSQPLTIPASVGVDHFAAFPMEWPRRLILGWSPSGICAGCGEGRRPVSVATAVPHWKGGSIGTGRRWRELGDDTERRNGNGETRFNMAREVTGEVCACPDLTAPTRPSVVVDPFGGTGTVALMADVLGRHGITVDMSRDYCRAAIWRTTDPGERARAMQVEKPDPVMDGQLDLLAEISSS